MTTQPQSTAPNATETSQVIDRQQAISQIADFIMDNSTWMLTTSGSDHVIRSRPMLNVNEKFDGELYLFTKTNDNMVCSINENPQSNIVISEPNNHRYVSVTGKAKHINDAKKLELLWNDRCRKWFGLEQPDESIAVIRFDVDAAEYWDTSQNLFGRIGNFFSGSVPSMDNVKHSVVEWNPNGSISETSLSQKRS